MPIQLQRRMRRRVSSFYLVQGFILTLTYRHWVR